MISLPLEPENFNQKLFDIKQLWVDYLEDKDKLSSLLDKSIIGESINLIKRGDAVMKY